MPPSNSATTTIATRTAIGCVDSDDSVTTSIA